MELRGGWVGVTVQPQVACVAQKGPFAALLVVLVGALVVPVGVPVEGQVGGEVDVCSCVKPSFLMSG